MAVDTPSFAFAMVALCITSSSFGWALEANLHRLSFFLCLAVLACFVFANRAADVVFGWPDIPKTLWCAELWVGIIFIAFPASVLLYLFVVASPAVCVLVTPCLLPVGVYFLFNLRGPGLAPGVVLYLFASDPRTGISNAASNFLFALGLASASFTPYLRDQRVSVSISLVGVLASITSGGLIYLSGPSSSDTLACFVPIPLYVYLLILAARRARTLPSSLHNVKFLRLGYLRKMIGSEELGLAIKRCQELPETAFGDVTKSDQLIAISHRWLDRYTCDVVTPDNPKGLRLSSMIEHLRPHFPVMLSDAALGDASFATWVFRMLTGLRVGGFDVVLFFDFAALPQIGKNHNGDILPRTKDEAVIFSEALPAMGALYTMYPVLVTPEVSPRTHPYFSSGWCFSEFCSAMVSGQLSEYSSATIEEFIATPAEDEQERAKTIVDFVNSGTMSPARRLEFMHAFEALLATKKFFDQDDAKKVHGIVSGYLVKCLLLDAVRKQSLEDVRKFLQEFADAGLAPTINQAVDQSLDTVLHVAARLPSEDVVLALLEHDADPGCRNFRGDTPAQFFGFPRVGQSASVCRQFGSQKAGYPSYQRLHPQRMKV